MCLQFQYSFCDTVYRNSLLIKKVSNRIKKRQSEIREKKYHVILAQVIRDTCPSITYYFFMGILQQKNDSFNKHWIILIVTN